MGKRGPKPRTADDSRNALTRLKWAAVEWASFLYSLRDGQSGIAQKMQGWKSEEEIKKLIGERQGVPKGIRVPTGTAGVEIIPINRKVARQFITAIRELKDENWLVSPPLFPNPKAWERLKNAHTIQEGRRAADSVYRWERQLRPVVIWARLPRMIRTHADALLTAKRMPNYPRSGRTRSDDKRILFYAKVLAGLSLGIAPATAVKRLGHWGYPKDWAEVPVLKLAERHQMPKRKSSKQEKPNE